MHALIYYNIAFIADLHCSSRQVDIIYLFSYELQQVAVFQTLFSRFQCGDVKQRRLFTYTEVFRSPRTSLSAVVDYLSSVSIRASICSQNSSWHADFIVLAFVNQDFLIKNYLVFCSYVIYFKVISVCLRAEVLIHTGIVVQSHANERVNDGDPFQKRLTMWLALRMFSWKKKKYSLLS